MDARAAPAEKACAADPARRRGGCGDFVKNRAKEEANIRAAYAYYDAMRVKQEDDDEEEVEVKKTLDYLSPYMPPLLAGESMSAKEAAATREKCLAATRARSWDAARRAIIERREDEENAAARSAAPRTSATWTCSRRRKWTRTTRRTRTWRS